MWKPSDNLLSSYCVQTWGSHSAGIPSQILKPPCESGSSSLPMRETAWLRPALPSWALHSLLGDRIICRWFFFFKSNRVGSNLHSALIRLIWWQQNKNYFLWLHREFPDPDEGKELYWGQTKITRELRWPGWKTGSALRESCLRSWEASARGRVRWVWVIQRYLLKSYIIKGTRPVLNAGYTS